jgi:cobalt-zinc-cadmium efflux system outer membrane protein
MRRPALAAALAALLLVAPIAPAQTAEAPVITAEDVLRRWLARSQEVASLRAQVRGARFDVVTAALWPNPSIQVNFLGTPAGTPPDGRTNLGVQLTQPLTVFGQVRTRREAAVAALSQSEVSVATSLWETASDLQTLMVARAFADARVTVAERNLAEVARLEGIVERRVAAGASSPYDALRVSIGASTLRAALNDARVQRDRAEARLSALLADPLVTAVPITRESLSAFRGPEDPRALLELALRRRPDLELARRGVAVARASERRWASESRWAPSVSLGAYGTQDPGSISVTAGLSFPLPVFDRSQGLIGRSRAEAEGQGALAAALEVRVAREVSGAWEARGHAREALVSFRAQTTAAAEELLRRAEVTYQGGGNSAAAFSIQDLFDAYRSTWDVRVQELTLQQTFAEAEADLERAAALVVP